MRNLQRQKNAKKTIVTVLSLLLLAFVGYAVKFVVVDSDTAPATQEQAPPTPPATEEALAVTTPVDTVKDTLVQFSPNEFKLFYDNLRQPSLEPVDNSPVISGNDIADARIRDIAEKRGYRLRNSPSGTLESIDGERLQSPVVAAWTKLKARAANDGHSMTLVSGYRSVADQRALFLSRLAATGASIEQVAAGEADAKVNQVLITSSIPGYSKTPYWLYSRSTV